MQFVEEFSNSSADEEDATLSTDLLPKNRGGSRSRRHQIHRGARRLAMLVPCALLVPFLITISYSTIKDSVKLRRTGLVDWGYNISRNLSIYVLPENNTTLMEPRHICNEKIFLLIVVCSSVDNFAARQNIRETWGNTTEFNYATFEQLHKPFKGKYLEPIPERLKYYSNYLKGECSKSDGSKDINLTVSPTAIPMRVVFLIGRRKYESLQGNETPFRLRTESEQYNDIIQENFIDSYKNLTIKSVMMLKWVQRHCLNNVAFIMKCDDDTFVNVPNLLHILLGGTIPLYSDTLNMHDARSYHVLANYNRLNVTHDLLMGRLFCGASPIADVSSKWYMPAYMFPGETYPNYLSGASYIMSSDVIRRLYLTALNTSLVYIEDIYITGICAQRAILRPYHSPLFNFEESKSRCNCKGSITQHYIKNDAMFELYAFVNNMNTSCAPPGKYFKTMRLHKGNCY